MLILHRADLIARRFPGLHSFAPDDLIPPQRGRRRSEDVFIADDLSVELCVVLLSLPCVLTFLVLLLNGSLRHVLRLSERNRCRRTQWRGAAWTSQAWYIR